LNIIGITDLAESKTKEQREEAISTLLEITVNEQKRYEVYLPWKDGHPGLVDNKKTAEKRLLAVIRHLSTIDKLEEYDRVLAEWLEIGVIEQVSEKEEKNFVYFLPHHAVIN
jgi:hypothetical protein